MEGVPGRAAVQGGDMTQAAATTNVAAQQVALSSDQQHPRVRPKDAAHRKAFGGAAVKMRPDLVG